jgi:hypothetical protein
LECHGFNRLTAAHVLGLHKSALFREIKALGIMLPEHNAIVSLVDQILKAKAIKPNADTSQIECELDQRVYWLFCLTKDEIKIVEEEN